MYNLLLSSGRTGTTFLTDVITIHHPHVKVLQEPIPSRTIYMMANANDYGLPLRKSAYFLYRISQFIWRLNANADYIEVNPFVSPIAQLLKPDKRMQKILMMVRHPYAWIESMLKFKGYSWRAKVTPLLPFVYSKPSINLGIWNKLDPIEKFAWRWVILNENIIKCRENGFEMMVIRYEDLYKSEGIDTAKLEKIYDFFGFDKLTDIKLDTMKNCRKNSSEGMNRTIWQKKRADLLPAVESITCELRHQFGYD
jgi:hypothetical protein